MSIVDQLGGMFRESQSMGSWGLCAGVVLAEVVNIEDPDKLNRVQCRLIGQPEEAVTDWCYFMAPLSGDGCGLFFPPQVNDLVVLSYLNGDIHRPIVLGGYWDQNRKAPFVLENGVAQDYVLRTPNRVDLTVHDEQDKQTVTLTMPSGMVLRLDDEKKTAVLQDQEGKNALTMDLENGGITACCEKTLTLSAGDTAIVLESSGSVSLKCSSDLSLETGSVTCKSQGQLNLQGSSAQIKGEGSVEVSAGGSATIKGSVVKIN